MLFAIRFKSADGLLQQDFNPKEFKETFGLIWNESTHTLRFPIMRTLIPISSYQKSLDILENPQRYRSYRYQTTLTEPIVIYNHRGEEEKIHKRVVVFQEVLE